MHVWNHNHNHNHKIPFIGMDIDPIQIDLVNHELVSKRK